jgi:hypothetical protein
MTYKTSTLSLVATLTFAFTASAAEIRGIVIKADDVKKELSINRGLGLRGIVLTFVLDKDTEILIDKQPGKVADLTEGKRVQITYELRGEKRVARKITLNTAGGAGAALGPMLAPKDGKQGGAAPLPMPVAKDANTVAGLLRRVAYTDRELVVIQSGSKGEAQVETTILVPESAKVLRDQKPIRFEDLKEGDQAVVQTEKKDRKIYAKTIQVGSVAAENPRATDGSRIERLRQILKMVDAALQRLDDR